MGILTSACLVNEEKMSGKLSLSLQLIAPWQYNLAHLAVLIELLFRKQAAREKIKQNAKEEGQQLGYYVICYNMTKNFSFDKTITFFPRAMNEAKRITLQITAKHKKEGPNELGHSRLETIKRCSRTATYAKC